MTRRDFVVVDYAGDGELVIASDAFGNVAARPVLLVHGGGQTRHSWGPTADALAEAGWYAVAYDQRGHGESDRSVDGHYEVESFAVDLLAIAREFDQPPVVVGASLGGLAGLLVEGDMAPGTFSALVLVDITPRQEAAGVERIVGFMTERARHGFATLDEAADAVAAYQPHRERRPHNDGLRKNLRLDPDGRWRWHWDPDLFNERSGLRASQRAGVFLAAAAQLTLPTLLVRGRLSDLVSPETAQEFLEVAPHACFVDVSDAGHMVAGDRNDLFTDAVLEFLRSVHG